MTVSLSYRVRKVVSDVTVKALKEVISVTELLYGFMCEHDCIAFCIFGVIFLTYVYLILFGGIEFVIKWVCVLFSDLFLGTNTT